MSDGSNLAREELVGSEASQSGSSVEHPPDYGAVSQRSDVVEVTLESSVFRVTVNSQRPDPSSTTSNATISSPNRRMRLLALRTYMEMMLAFTLLRKKYLDHVLISVYFALLVGLSPLSIYLYIQDITFSSVYLYHSKLIHLVVQMLNVILLYLYISTGFNLRALFAACGLHPLLGNVFVAACSGALLAVECVDRIAVYLKTAHYDHPSSLLPRTSMLPSGGTTPDSPLFIIMSFVGFFAVMMAIVNGLHLVYYGFEFRRAMEGALEHVRDGDLFETVVITN